MKTSGIVWAKGQNPASCGRTISALACLLLATGCGSGGDGSTPAGAPADDGSALRGTIGASGGELVGQVGSALEGVRLVVPEGALAENTPIEIRPASAVRPLPATAVECGPEFTIAPAGLALAKPASLTLPFDEGKVTDQYRFDDEVKVWSLDGDKWGQRIQTNSSQGSVVVDIEALTTLSAGVNPPAQEDLVQFQLHPNPKFIGCLAGYPDDPSRAPTVTVTVVRGDLNDGLFLDGRNIKPNLAFDMFTVQESALLADGTPNPNFKDFGLAWYQSDLEANDRGRMRASIRTILLDQIFGFDPRVSLAPTSTFQLGFWFNNPKDAEGCGFDVTKPTPFNGEHQAGPLAMISVPDADTGLGPLCTKPDTSVTPARCDP